MPICRRAGGHTGRQFLLDINKYASGYLDLISKIQHRKCGLFWMNICPNYAPCFVYVGGMASTRARRAKRSGQTQTPACRRAEFSLKVTEEEGRSTQRQVNNSGGHPQIPDSSQVGHKAQGQGKKQGRKEGRKVGERTRKQEKGKTH